MQLSKQVKFLPWVGEIYKQQSRKILFLGESHYEADETRDSDFTCEVIKRQFGEGLDAKDKLKRYRFFNGLERLFSGNSELTKAESQKFWNKVAFYNFVQFGMSTAEARPTAGQFRKSIDPFVEVVCELKPDVVVVAGITTWDSLPNKESLKWELIRGELVKSPQANIKRALELWRCTTAHNNQTHQFLSFFIPHPSGRSFGSAARWISWPTEAFRLIEVQTGRASN